MKFRRASRRRINRVRIERAIGNLSASARMSAIELARVRIKAAEYPRGSIGRDCYRPRAESEAKYVPALTFAQWRAVYRIALASLN